MRDARAQRRGFAERGRKRTKGGSLERGRKRTKGDGAESCVLIASFLRKTSVVRLIQLLFGIGRGALKRRTTVFAVFNAAVLTDNQ